MKTYLNKRDQEIYTNLYHSIYFLSQLDGEWENSWNNKEKRPLLKSIRMARTHLRKVANHMIKDLSDDELNKIFDKLLGEKR
jgi:hypothetical protein